MSHAKLSPLDVAHHFLTSDNALINFLGVHYLMMEPWVTPNPPFSLPFPLSRHYIPHSRGKCDPYRGLRLRHG